MLLHAQFFKSGMEETDLCEIINRYNHALCTAYFLYDERGNLDYFVKQFQRNVIELNLGRINGYIVDQIFNLALIK